MPRTGSKPTETPYYGFISGPNSPNGFYYGYLRVRRQLPERGSKARNQEELGQNPQLFFPANYFAGRL
jgi:pectin methylesterase-like acyl-CoA thioesterase